MQSWNVTAKHLLQHTKTLRRDYRGFVETQESLVTNPSSSFSIKVHFHNVTSFSFSQPQSSSNTHVCTFCVKPVPEQISNIVLLRIHQVNNYIIYTSSICYVQKKMNMLLLSSNTLQSMTMLYVYNREGQCSFTRGNYHYANDTASRMQKYKFSTNRNAYCLEFMEMKELARAGAGLLL